MRSAKLLHPVHVSAIVNDAYEYHETRYTRTTARLHLCCCFPPPDSGSLALLYVQRRPNYLSSKQVEHLSLEREVIAAFKGEADTSADAPSLNRLLRGKLVAIDEQQQTITVATYINFPDLSVTRDITVSLTPRTQFLCWAKIYRTENGAEIDVEKAGYLLREDEKLFMQGERRITLDEANTILSQEFETNPITKEQRNAVSVLSALETSYSLRRENRVFQVVLLGCDEK